MATSGVQGGFNVTPLTGAKSMSEAVNMAKKDDGNSQYTDQVTLKTNSETDQKIYENVVDKQEQINSGEEKYDVLSNNCTDAIERPIEKATGVSLPDNPEPNTNFERLKNGKNHIQDRIGLSEGTLKVKTIPMQLDGLPPLKVVIPKVAEEIKK